MTLRKEGNAASLRYTELYGVIDGENESPLVMLQCGVSCLQDAIVSGKGPIMLTADNFERVAGKGTRTRRERDSFNLGHCCTRISRMMSHSLIKLLPR